MEERSWLRTGPDGVSLWLAPFRQLPWESQQVPPPSVSDAEATGVDATVFTHDPTLVKRLWVPPAKPVSEDPNQE